MNSRWLSDNLKYRLNGSCNESLNDSIVGGDVSSIIYLVDGIFQSNPRAKSNMKHVVRVGSTRRYPEETIWFLRTFPINQIQNLMIWQRGRYFTQQDNQFFKDPLFENYLVIGLGPN